MFKLLCFIYVFGLVHYAHSLTEADIKIQFTRHVMKCMKDHPDVSVTELTDLQRLIPPKNMEVKCLLACAYKLEGLMDKDGFYSVEHGYKMAELTKNGDETRLVNGKKMTDLCSKYTNEAKVNEKTKDCERAGLIFKCSVENAPKFGFKL